MPKATPVKSQSEAFHVKWLSHISGVFGEPAVPDRNCVLKTKTNKRSSSIPLEKFFSGSHIIKAITIKNKQTKKTQTKGRVPSIPPTGMIYIIPSAGLQATAYDVLSGQTVNW